MQFCNHLGLTNDERDAYTRLLELPDGLRPNWENLKRIVVKIQEHNLYSNLTMLTRLPRHAPTKEEIVSDVLGGIGGGCVVTNVFAHSYLIGLGYECRMLPCYANRGQQRNHPERMNHIGLQVCLGERKYYLDFGNGYPYFDVCAFHKLKKEYLSNGMRYRLAKDPDPDKPNHYRLEHALIEPEKPIDFKENLYIEDKPVGLSYFDEITKLHYMEESFGRMLRCFRLIKFPERGVYGIYYNKKNKHGELRYSQNGQIYCKKINTHEISTLARREFKVDENQITMALGSLGARIGEVA